MSCEPAECCLLKVFQGRASGRERRGRHSRVVGRGNDDHPGGRRALEKIEGKFRQFGRRRDGESVELSLHPHYVGRCVVCSGSFVFLIDGMRETLRLEEGICNGGVLF